MDVASDHGSAANVLAIDLEIASFGSVSCCFCIPFSFFTMCSSLPCLSSSVYIHNIVDLESFFRKLLLQLACDQRDMCSYYMVPYLECYERVDGQ